MATLLTQTLTQIYGLRETRSEGVFLSLWKRVRVWDLARCRTIVFAEYLSAAKWHALTPAFSHRERGLPISGLPRQREHLFGHAA